jgi:catechol-2,3-dioxygenase
MWGSVPIFLSESVAITVNDLSTATNWYQEKLALQLAKTKREDDSGLPFVDLHYGQADTFITLVKDPSRKSAADSRPILFTKNLKKAHEWLVDRGVGVEPIASDSGGNQLFYFHDLDGNRMEVCLET